MDANSASRKGLVAASSLLESVLALGLLAAAMSIAVLIHFQTVLSDHASVRLEAWFLTEEAIIEIEATGKADVAMASPDMRLTMKMIVLGEGQESVHFVCLKGEEVILERDVIIALP